MARRGEGEGGIEGSCLCYDSDFFFVSLPKSFPQNSPGPKIFFFFWGGRVFRVREVKEGSRIKVGKVATRQVQGQGQESHMIDMGYISATVGIDIVS